MTVVRKIPPSLIGVPLSHTAQRTPAPRPPLMAGASVAMRNPRYSSSSQAYPSLAQWWAHLVGALRVEPHKHWADYPPQDRGDAGCALTNSLHLAREIRRLVGITGSVEDGDLRIWAEWAAPVHAIRADVICRYLIRRLTTLAPVFHGADRRKLIRPWSAAAVIHSGDHEQAEPIVW